MSKKLLADSNHDRFADYFVICGLNEQEGLEPHQCSDSEDSLLTPFQLSYKPSILWHFPENDQTNLFEPDGIKVLCMPRGVYFRKSVRRTATKFHSFLQTRENGTKIYGFVLTFFEKVINENIIIAMDTLFKMFDTELALVSKTDQPFYMNRPFNKRLSSSFNSFKKDDEQLFVSKSICIIMKKPFVRLARHCLENILQVGLYEEKSSLCVESYIYNVLYEIPALPPGKTMRYTSLNGDPIIVRNPHLNELPYFDYSMKEVLITLGLENLVDLFTCMLLEHQILLLSSDSHKLMLIAESLTTLFFPLLWQHVYVPVLPPFLLHYLDAPVPFIMGLCYETEDEKDRLDLPQEGSLCLLDIDNNSIHLPQEIPELPVRNELIAELESITNLYNIELRKGCLLLKNNLSNNGNPENDMCDEPNNSDISMNKSVEYYSNQNSDYYKIYSKLSISRTSSLVIGKPKSHPNVKFMSGNWSGDIIPTQHEESKTSSLLSKESPESKKPVNPRVAAMMAVIERVGLETSNVIISENASITDPLSNKDGEHVWGSRSITCMRTQQHEDEINIIVREIFVNCFTHILVDYEHFVILPQQTKEEWLVDRDQMQNFDKAAFLSDQSQAHLPFMTLFVETQGFASLIDMKIMALWEDCDPRLAYFDKRIDKLKVKLGLIRSPTYEKCTTISSAIEAYIKSCSQIDHNAVQPHPLMAPLQRDKKLGYFPLPDKNCILESKKKSKKVNWKKQEKSQLQKEHIALNESLKTNLDGHKIKQKLAERVKKYMQESKSNEDTHETGATQRTLNVYAEKLLKECKMKTKRLVVLKLGQEAIELGHVGPNSIGIEENTLIASLCDLLERVWCHGVQLNQLDFDKESVKSKFVQRMRQSKSALWSHLLAFYQKECSKLAAIYGIANVECVPGEMKNLVNEANQKSFRSKSPANEDGTYFDQLTIKEAKFEGVNKSPTTSLFQSREHQDLLTKVHFLNNLKTIIDMKEIKTDTGYARAWTRLALEKKTLAEELRILLDQKKILEARYKNYAFIRTEDEMEQFLIHLLSLNAVDFYCFTNGFSNTVMIYKFHVVLGKHIGFATTANCWLNLTGSFGNTGTINIPKGEIEFRFKHKNLGILTALRIGHDNMGISPGWFVEYVIVSNEVTGHMYRFQCGRWLSKNEDDGSTERLLIASMQNHFSERKPTQKHNSSFGRTSPTNASSVRNCSPNQKLTASDIQEKMADAVNNIVKYFYKDSEENMTFLMCGEGGFCEAMKLVFLHGYKSTRLFAKKLFVWDYIKKVFDDYVYADDSNISANALQLRSSFCTIIQTIDTAQLAIGKEQKFELFICLGLRDRHLQSWLRLLNQSSVTLQMYEPWSFFLDTNRFSFLVGVLDSLTEFEIVLDQSVTRGV
ncbi:DENN domain-containing protein 5B isoform X1 [Hydra vulgaris]|uniref:DENN domain-containing protein 5B isoform X1 n=1 Tax=Hydra vulgaris TaxID=6087 RepID=UPI001F5FC4D8|nr:DENN domain-containing protein 5B [Hydra vulgaris]